MNASGDQILSPGSSGGCQGTNEYSASVDMNVSGDQIVSLSRQVADEKHR